MRSIHPQVLFLDHTREILGGAEINLIELLRHSRTSQQFCATVGCPEGGELWKALGVEEIRRIPYELPDEIARFKVVGQKQTRLGSLIAAFRSARHGRRVVLNLIREIRPDVVVTIPNKDHLVCGPAVRAAKVPLVAWFNDILSEDFFPWFLRQGLAMSLRRNAARAVAVSEFSRCSLLRHGLNPGRVRVIHNGVAIPGVSGGGSRELRARLGLPESCLLAGLIGRWTPWKGQELLVEIARRISAAAGPWHFVVMGGVYGAERAFADRVISEIHRSGLDSFVHILPFQQDVCRIISELDVLLHTSLKPEPFGRVLIEAMSCGVPVVASREGGVPEIVRDGENGLLCSVGDAAGYAAALTRLGGDPGMRLRLGAQGRRWVESRFSLERVLQDWGGLIQELVGE